MPLPRKREIELFLNVGTVNDLIIAHLYNIRVIKDTEEVTDITISGSRDECVKLTVRFEPDTQVIFHE